MLVPQLLWLLATAQVAPPAVDVQWSGLPECPDRDALFVAIERRLGRPLGAGEVTVEARVDREGRGYVLHLKLAVGSRGEEREVHDPSCTALLEATAVRVVAAIAGAPVVPPPAAAEAGPAPARAAEPVPDKPVGAVPKAVAAVEEALEVLGPPKPPPAPVPKNMARKPGVMLRAHGGAELGAVPVLTGAVALAVGLLWPRWRLELHGTVLPPQSATRAGANVRAGLYAAAVHTCYRLGRFSRLTRGVFELPGCLGLELGGMRGEARHLPDARAAAGLWVAAVLSPALAWHVTPRMSVWTTPQLVVAMARPDFQAGAGKEAESIFRPSVVSGRLLLGIELRLRDRW